MNRHQCRAGLLGTVPLLSAQAAIAADTQCQTPIDVIGTETRMRAHDFRTIAWLKNAPLSDLSVGYGPGADPRAKISIIDGQYHVVQPQGDGVEVAVNPSEQGAAMLVCATSKARVDGGTLDDICDLASLNLEISDRGKEMGCEGDIALPFRITAHADELNWSVDGDPEKAPGTIEDADVIVAGVYSNHDKANTFMSPGLSLHAHVLVPATGMAGHVVKATLADGAALQLPSVN